LLELPERIEQRPLPEVEIIDMRMEFQRTKKDQVISARLLTELGECLERGEQAMVLLNRRGFSAFVLCRQCGETVECRNCAIAMTYHKSEHRLVCHYCGFMRPAPRTCPKCGSEYIQYLGTGSEKLEHILHGIFPQARIARLDRDTVRGRDDLERILSSVQAREIDLLIGTQMIAKGHDIPNVTLVGVVGSDAALGFPDFRAAERTFQLLTQVAGRAGRGETPGRVVLQTFFPDHYAIQFAAAHDYCGFYEKESRFRSWMHYPPFNAVSNVLVRSPKLDEALTWSGILGKWFQSTRMEGVRVMGPAAAPIIRLKTEYRYHFLLKSKSRERMNGVLRTMIEHAVENRIPRTNLVVDVDALSLI
jgi:primosomal protein N' (replication factor Y)